jgi:pimeloyl-ACP methyl ester carboxylesterase
MPLDNATGVYYEVHGSGEPLMVGLPLMASHVEIFGPDSAALLDGYLQRLTDRYRVLLLDYPAIGRSRDIAPAALTVDRVCSDLLGVASAAGFDRFAFWGYSWSGAVGLQLASRTDRLTSLVVGGWPPLGAPYAGILEVTRRRRDDPEPGSLAILRSAAQYAQWTHYYESMGDWQEDEALRYLRCPAMVYFGAEGDLVEAGIPIPIASTIRARRPELESLGWTVVEFQGHGHMVTLHPELVVPEVRAFLDRVLARKPARARL